MAEVRHRKGHHLSLQRLLVTVQALDPTTTTGADIHTFLGNAEHQWEKLQEFHATLLDSAVDEAAAQVQYNAIIPMEETYINVKRALNNLRSRVASPTPPTAPPTHNMKLPHMSLPTFDGKYEDWPTFSDLFKAGFHNNLSLSGAQKLQYLKSCVKGEAANSIKSFQITDGNYQEAWNLLESQFDNKREIVSSNIRKLLFQPSIKHESSSALQEMLNTTLESIRSLKVLGESTDKWDSIIVVLLEEKFDADTRAEWARSLKGTSPSTFKEIHDFIVQHIRTLHAKGSMSVKHSVSKVSEAKGVGGHRRLNTHHTSFPSCQHCKGNHQLFQCAKLKDMEGDQRYKIVKSLNLCLNCLKEGHMYSKCPNPAKCRKCNKRHNTFLHFNTDTLGTNHQQSGSQQNSSSQLTVLTSTLATTSTRLLKTALVDVLDSKNVKCQVRVFIDEGAEGSLIKESTLNRLGLAKEKADVIVSGVCGTTASRSRWMTNIRLNSQVNTSYIDLELYAVPKITDTLNRLNDRSQSFNWSHISGLRLADPFYCEGGEIDILIGADTAPYVIKPGIRRADRNSPVAQETIFGWVITGNVITTDTLPKQSSITINSVTCEISDTLRKFWEIEEVPSQQSLTQEEEACEQHFISTHSRLASGRYVVRLPFNDKKQQLGESKQQAYRRLLSLERRFKREPQHKDVYVQFMREYEDLGHMKKAMPATQSNNTFYLPHHFVLKADSTTTKQRTVFDGSAKTTTGVSLNDALSVGGTVQPDLFTLLLRFRCNKIALKADIAKMYRQFMVHEDDQDYQRILFRESPDQPIQEYQLTTVTYGTASAPFAATRCLNQLAIDEKERFAAAAEALLYQTYVDDLIASVASEEEAEELVHQLIGITKTAGMEIRKWCSNNSNVLRTLPEQLLEKCDVSEFSDGGSIKALGIRWNPNADYFSFSITASSIVPTKRNILSEIAKTFDPLGWLAPVTINAKLILQRIWLRGHNWDESVSVELQQQWNCYQQNLSDIHQIHIPRCAVQDIPLSVEIHGFCDSSEDAYASCVYLKCIYKDGSVSVVLLTARTKVAPLKTMSLPKLELAGANLLSDTIEAVKKAIFHKFPNATIFCWSDSTIALRWISSHSRKWKTFVANRVSAIQSIVPPEHWHHVRSADNPADLPSRGIQLSELKTSNLWWHGPSFLQGDTYPILPITYNDEEAKKEERSKQLAFFHLSQTSVHTTLFTAFSSFCKVCRCSAYLIRFIAYLKDKSTVRCGPLTVKEFNCAKVRLIRWSQAVSFPEDLMHLDKFQCVASKSKLVQLSPFLDSDRLLSVGGRLQNAQLPNKARHPIILPSDHPITYLIIDDIHRCALHSGFTLTFSTIRQEYWILRGRDKVRHAIRKCITCRKSTAKTLTQLMGNLPKGRVVPTRPFYHAGVDFAGPFSTKMKKGRHVSVEKSYMAIFVCFATKAVHLEAVTSLATDTFIACYERFVARRGVSAHLYSDCGTNFVGADKVLQIFFKQENERLQNHFVNKGTQWHFNPPSSPHQGGLWEAGVKSVKKHFYRVVGQQTLTFEQFSTLLCKIEACLNSRPLCALSSEPGDLDALTPGHFLIGCPLNNIPEPDVTHLKQNRLGYWELVKQMTQHFWKRWSQEYLTSLQQRFKWTQKRDNVKVGDLVVVADDQLPVTKWKMGRILETYAGADGLVRSVLVKSDGGKYKRPITKISPLIPEQSG